MSEYDVIESQIEAVKEIVPAIAKQLKEKSEELQAKEKQLRTLGKLTSKRTATILGYASRQSLVYNAPEFKRLNFFQEGYWVDEVLTMKSLLERYGKAKYIPNDQALTLARKAG